MFKTIMVRMLELSLNSISKMNPHYDKLLAIHSGKVLQLKITDISQELYFIFRHNKIFVSSIFTDKPNSILTTTSFSLLKHLGPSSDLHSIRIEGEVELASDMQSLLTHLPFEEYLSYFLGDFTAYHIGHIFKQIKQTVEVTKQRNLEDILDYIQEEKKFIPTREEVEDFYEHISKLRQDIERLEAHTTKLRMRMNNENK